MVTAIQKLVLRPNKVLNTILKSNKKQLSVLRNLSCGSRKQNHPINVKLAYTAIIPKTATGFRPYRSATIPHGTDVNPLPSMNADPTNKISLGSVVYFIFFLTIV